MILPPPPKGVGAPVNWSQDDSNTPVVVHSLREATARRGWRGGAYGRWLMVAVPLKQVEMLRGVLWLTNIERAEALAAGKWDVVANKDLLITRLEQRLADLERQAEDELAFALLLHEPGLPGRGHPHHRRHPHALGDVRDLPA